jgi:osmoprotectant transport system substrate-binding protein
MWRDVRRHCLLPLAVAILAAASTGGCGGSGGGAAADAGNASRPGEGRPPITIGTKVSPVSVLLGQLYAQALRARGYTVELQEVVGEAPDALAALRAGRIDAMALPVDALDEALGISARRASSADAAYAEGRAAAAQRGLAVLAPTPFTTATALAVLPDYARRHEIESITDLARAGHVRLGASPGFRNRGGIGLEALQRTYEIRSLTYYPLTTGIQYRVLDAGKIDVAEVATTDGQLADGEYTLLRDPQHLFGFEHVAPVATVRAQTAAGPSFTETLDAVSARLTPQAMQELNGEIALQHRSPEQVAREFLQDAGLA